MTETVLVVLVATAFLAIPGIALVRAFWERGIRGKWPTPAKAILAQLTIPVIVEWAMVPDNGRVEAWPLMWFMVSASANIWGFAILKPHPSTTQKVGLAVFAILCIVWLATLPSSERLTAAGGISLLVNFYGLGGLIESR
jgi:hypothetical protein